MIQLNRSLVIILGGFLLLSLTFQAKAQEETTQNPDNELKLQPEEQQQQQSQDPLQPQTTPQPNERSNTSPANGTCIMELLINPLRSTLRHARRLFGSRLDDVRNIRESVRNITERARLETFKVFMRLYNKTYSPEEIPRRMALFFRRRNEIQQSVRQFLEGKSSFAMKENSFLDWDEEELKKLTGVSLPDADQLDSDERSGYLNATKVAFARVGSSSSDAIEDEEDIGLNVHAESIAATKDWRTSGCVAAPINQLKCGACYAIATMSVVESMRCIKKVSAPTLSPQQIVDCATPRAGYENYGCDGGWPTRVLKYLQDVQVAARETCYPFQWRQNTCKLNQVKRTSGCTVSASPTGSRQLQYKVLHNERDILYHVAKTGPVVTVMKASDKFLYYGKGIFDDSRCSNRRDDVDHAIVITGYGKENGVDYWVIKNSWGIAEWGIDGYAKYRRGKNACSIGHWGWVVTE